ncbi:hypothetical protein GPX89_01970 [Nocardia sp. ET3-3]|uniref:Schlafen AlbA-2 domain-containing protein n=1 Tax=Nocardia terrae TaxID=2675851 RepID=A0A7K1UQ33_9NOCA|nr:hypothetical protein [Nocardia terrae]MVU76008.1 hypothetical protein [Nocardia terrae]
MPATVRYRSDDNTWYFGGELRLLDDAGALVIKRSDLAVTTATDLARALRQAEYNDPESDHVLIDLAPEEEYSPGQGLVDPISFVLLDDGNLAIRFYFTSNDCIDDQSQLHTMFKRLAGPLLGRVRARLVTVEVDDYSSTEPYSHTAVVSIPVRSKTLEQLYETAASLVALFEAAATGNLTRETVVDLVLGGRADLLIGLPEGPWLDVKSQHYDLTLDRGKISLAEAVSRFCNAEEGGIVVVGMDTKRIPGGELIKSVRPVPLDTATARRYRQAIENRIFPFPAALKIQTVETSSGHGLVVVSVPPQDEELKPFLVHGAIVGGRVEGAYISILRRSGEDSIPITAQQIHSTLAAGRALLRRGEIPPVI